LGVTCVHLRATVVLAYDCVVRCSIVVCGVIHDVRISDPVSVALGRAEGRAVTQ
jgi:hypothetical protein